LPPDHQKTTIVGDVVRPGSEGRSYLEQHRGLGETEVTSYGPSFNPASRGMRADCRGRGEDLQERRRRFSAFVLDVLRSSVIQCEIDTS